MSADPICAPDHERQRQEVCHVRISAPQTMNKPTGAESNIFDTPSAITPPPAFPAIPTLHFPSFARQPIAAPREFPTIAGYEIVKLLGRGGMGVIYLARHFALGRLVALKMVLGGAHASLDQLARFHTEAEAAARLQHPNIVQVFEFGESDGQPFLTMEYVEGSSLAAQLDGKPLPWRSATALLATLADGVHHAHQRGIVHRDLKPGNILLQKVDRRQHTVDSNGAPASGDASKKSTIATGSCLLTTVYSPKISDFGIAKLLIGGDNQTPTGAMLGTPGYMAPEQIGTSAPVGPAADIHALGAILFELLTGRPPFQAAEMLETLEQICFKEPVAPRRLIPTIPLDLETICLKCLQKEPRRRYESALALLEDLNRSLAGEPIRARPISLAERSARWARRRPAQAALLAVTCVAALALTGLAVGLSYNTRLTGLNHDLESAVQTARDAQAEAERQRAGANKMEHWIRYVRDIHLADEAWQNGQVRRVSELLGGYSNDLRGWEWHYLRGLARKDGRTLPHTAGVLTVAFDPSGQRLATGCQDGTVWFWDVATRTKHEAAAQHAGAVWSVAYSPNGLLLASAGDDRRVRLWDSQTGRLVRILGNCGTPLRCLAFSPDGRILATAGKEGTIQLWELDSGRNLSVLPGHPGGVFTLAFAPDGRTLASGGADRVVRLWDIASDDLIRTLEGHTEDVHGVAFSSNGTVLASAGGDGAVRTWNVVSGKPLTTYHPPQKTAFLGVAFGSDGSVAAASEAHQVYLWDKLGLHTFRGHNHRVQGVGFSPDGRILASASSDWTVKLWDVNSSQEFRALPAQSDHVLGASFRSDGRQLVDAAVDGTIRLWDVKDSKLLQRWEVDLDRPRGITFSADGRFLAAAGRKGIIRCYDLTTSAIFRTWQHDAPARAVAFSPDGRLLASGDDEGIAKVWDVAGDRLVFTGGGHTGPVRALAFSPDGQTLASGSLDGVRLWDTATGQPRVDVVLDAPRVVALAFSPSGGLAVAQMGGHITLWDLINQSCQQTLLGHSAMVWSLAFTPDGTRLASASRDMTVKLWDTASGQEVLTLRGFTSEISGVAFSPGATCLVTTDLGGSVRIWDSNRQRK